MMRGMPRSVLHIESLALILGLIDISPDEAVLWMTTHRDEPLDQLPVMLMAQGYGVDNCEENHESAEGECDCFTQLTDSDLWELDEVTGKPVVEFAEWWGPYQLWKR
jgi:hypothetical protein